MAAAKKRRVVARVTLIASDQGKTQEIAPGQEADILADEADSLVRRGFASWGAAKPQAADGSPGLPLEDADA
ncbi:hypothetical protein D3877_12950 [Azospirillum cavernae]|uniref:Uncharacterized protein n=1 Tax=Azospirillum cavernae TaxID=2320860 RepID=A0A418VVF4_9PROT|nr:hypothetical protein [Azospirillum cavernae]RJF81125.1 hypothetical protein D3877_12950 [Azospirillum cavernae]